MTRTGEHWDLVIVGAGAAGMMCASVAGQRGARVLLIDHAEKLAEKIRISGGGRCNFTNIATRAENFTSENPHFARAALARYGAADFIALVRRHGISIHEKHKGQFFCDHSSEQIIELLRAECAAGQVHWQMPSKVLSLRTAGEGFALDTDGGSLNCKHLVVATGGLSIPKIGASDYGYRIARQFGLRVVEPMPALVPLGFTAAEWAPLVDLAGIALEVALSCGSGRFAEDLLFTHRGLSGPAILQISSYWSAGQAISVNLVPQFSGDDFERALMADKSDSRQSLRKVLAKHLPQRLADGWLHLHQFNGERRIAETSDKNLRALAASLQRWSVVPASSEGWKKAEVTRGGVDTAELAQASLEAKRVPGLHFIGEVVDVTGWLGGYNFQWAWSSAVAAALAITASSQ